jgi:TrpR-related protein YerC/YecD
LSCTVGEVCYNKKVFSQGKGLKLGGVVMINPKLKDDLTDQLCETVLLLRGVEECYQFFEDICTISELKALAQRLEVARMLNAGHTYDDIVARTGASTATISRVKRCLHYGADGYKIVLERLQKQQEGSGTRDANKG